MELEQEMNQSNYITDGEEQDIEHEQLSDVERLIKGKVKPNLPNIINNFNQVLRDNGVFGVVVVEFKLGDEIGFKLNKSVLNSDNPPDYFTKEADVRTLGEIAEPICWECGPTWCCGWT